MKSQRAVGEKLDGVKHANEVINRDIAVIKRTFKQFGELNSAMNKIENDTRLV